MKTNYHIKPADVCRFLADRKCDIEKIHYDREKDTFIITLDETYHQMILQTLADIRDKNNCTEDEKAAIDVGISAIKTLIDMEIIER